MSDDTTTGSPALDLLAVIHGDGGQHTSAVGLPQSFEDAHAEVARLRVEVEILRAAADVASTRTVAQRWAERSQKLTRERTGRIAESWRYDLAAAHQLMGEDAAELSRLRAESTVLASVVEALEDPARPEESPVDAARRLRSFFQRTVNGGCYTRPRP